MKSIPDIRQSHPEYSDLSDQELSDKLYEKYYSDIPKNEFENKIGLKTQPEQVSHQDQQQKFKELATGGPLQDAASGFTQGVMNLPGGLANLGVSGINALTGSNVPKVPQFNFAPNNTASAVGDVGSAFVGPGELVKLLKYINESKSGNALSKIPGIAQAIEGAGNLINEYPTISKTIGNSLVGGAYTPEHPLAGMALGAAAAPVGKAVSSIYNTGKNVLGKLFNTGEEKFFDKFKPEELSNKIVEDLGQGNKTIDQNSKSLGSDIRKSYKQREEEAGIYLDHALDQAGKEKIYQTPNPLISTNIDKQKNILGRIDDLNIGSLAENFKQNPTFKNAHKLQSELGTWIGDFKQKPFRTPQENNDLSNVSSIRDQLKKDIQSFLERRDLTSNMPLKDTYQKGIDLYRENVAPYLSTDKLRKVVRGNKTLVKNIHKEFESPSDVIDSKTGEVKQGPINKIMQDLPEESRNKIIFNAVSNENKNPVSLLHSLKNARSKGYSNYFSPELDASINKLNERINNKEFAKKIGHLGLSGLGLGAVGAGYEAVNKLSQ